MIKRVAGLVALGALAGAMASAQHSNVEALVEAKKTELLKYNPYAKNNTELLRDKVFCLCTACSVVPIMARNDMSNKTTAYRHSQGDVERGLITKAELLAAVGTKTFIGYEDYFHLYRQHTKGELNVDGDAADVHLESVAVTQDAQSPSAAFPSQGCPYMACPMENDGMCLVDCNANANASSQHAKMQLLVSFSSMWHMSDCLRSHVAGQVYGLNSMLFLPSAPLGHV